MFHAPFWKEAVVLRLGKDFGRIFSLFLFDSLANLRGDWTGKRVPMIDFLACISQMLGGGSGWRERSRQCETLFLYVYAVK